MFKSVVHMMILFKNCNYHLLDQHKYILLFHYSTTFTKKKKKSIENQLEIQISFSGHNLSHGKFAKERV